MSNNNILFNEELALRGATPEARIIIRLLHSLQEEFKEAYVQGVHTTKDPMDIMIENSMSKMTEIPYSLAEDLYTDGKIELITGSAIRLRDLRRSVVSVHRITNWTIILKTHFLHQGNEQQVVFTIYAKDRERLELITENIIEMA